jgi:hypothetical protein
LALNLGIVDPGWHDRLATAVINFSKSDFEIRKGDTFFRVIFLCHKVTPNVPTDVSTRAYLERIKIHARLFSGTFLTMDSLVIEITDKVLGFPRWAVKLAAGAILVSLFSITLPLAWTAVSQNYVLPSRINSLEKAVSALERNCYDRY